MSFEGDYTQNGGSNVMPVGEQSEDTIGDPRPFDDPLYGPGYQAFFVILTIFLYMLVGLRFFILRKVKYKLFSPRGISDICIGTVTFFMTAFFVTYYVGFAYKRETFRLFARVKRFANMADFPEFEPVMPLLTETFDDFLHNYKRYMVVRISSENSGERVADQMEVAIFPKNAFTCGRLGRQACICVHILRIPDTSDESLPSIGVPRQWNHKYFPGALRGRSLSLDGE
jgi:hypothetical protein